MRMSDIFSHILSSLSRASVSISPTDTHTYTHPVMCAFVQSCCSVSFPVWVFYSFSCRLMLSILRCLEPGPTMPRNTAMLITSESTTDTHTQARIQHCADVFAYIFLLFHYMCCVLMLLATPLIHILYICSMYCNSHSVIHNSLSHIEYSFCKYTKGIFAKSQLRKNS